MSLVLAHVWSQPRGRAGAVTAPGACRECNRAAAGWASEARRSRRREKRCRAARVGRVSVLAAAVAGIVWLVLPARPTSAEERIRTRSRRRPGGGEAQGGRRGGGALRAVHRQGEGERASRDEVRRMLALELLRGAWVSVTISSAEVIVDGSRARANVDALLSRAEDRTKGLASLLPGEASVHRFSVDLEEEAGKWRVVSGTWRQIGICRRPSPGRALRIGEDASPRYVDRARRGRTPRRAHAMAVYTVLDAEQLAAALKQFGLARALPGQGRAPGRGQHRVPPLVRRPPLLPARERGEVGGKRSVRGRGAAVPARGALSGARAAPGARRAALDRGVREAGHAASPTRRARSSRPLRSGRSGAAGWASSSAGSTSWRRGSPPSRPNPYGRTWVAERVRELAPPGTPTRSGPRSCRSCARRLAVRRRLPGAPRGLVHGDLFVDNVLWIGDRVSALLDWEMSCVDPFAYDLGVASTPGATPMGTSADRARALLAGYRAGAGWSRRRSAGCTLVALRRAAVRGGPHATATCRRRPAAGGRGGKDWRTLPGSARGPPRPGPGGSARWLGL